MCVYVLVCACYFKISIAEYIFTIKKIIKNLWQFSLNVFRFDISHISYCLGCWHPQPLLPRHMHKEICACLDLILLPYLTSHLPGDAEVLLVWFVTLKWVISHKHTRIHTSIYRWRTHTRFHTNTPSIKEILQHEKHFKTFTLKTCLKCENKHLYRCLTDVSGVGGSVGR